MLFHNLFKVSIAPRAHNALRIFDRMGLLGAKILSLYRNWV